MARCDAHRITVMACSHVICTYVQTTVPYSNQYRLQDTVIWPYVDGVLEIGSQKFKGTFDPQYSKRYDNKCFRNLQVLWQKIPISKTPSMTVTCKGSCVRNRTSSVKLSNRIREAWSAGCGASRSLTRPPQRSRDDPPERRGNGTPFPISRP